MKRLFAIIGAVAMIGGAVVLRGVITDGGGGGGGGGGGSDDGETHLICATEVEAACQALADDDDTVTFEVEEAGVTAERLADPAFKPNDQDIDGWLTLNPWPELVDQRRARDNLTAVLGAPPEVLATSKLAVVGPADRVDALSVICGGVDQFAWKCLGEVAGQTWAQNGNNDLEGSIEVGHDDPSESATGLLILGQAASSFLGKTGFASNDFDQPFRSWLEQLENADPNLPLSFQTDPVMSQLEHFPLASWDAIGTLNPAASAAEQRTDDAFTVLYPAPMILAEVVLTPIAGHEVDIDTDDLTQALEDTGWTPGAAPQDAPDGPNAGVYEALITEWEQATR